MNAPDTAPDTARDTASDTAVAEATAAPSPRQMRDARARARAVAGKTGWLASILDHHVQIEACFAAVKDAHSAAARKKAHKQLAVLLTGHSIAEESVVYPALAEAGQAGDAHGLYAEQSTAKVEMAALEALDPMDQAYLDKLEHIRLAVAQHVYEEESECFPALHGEADSATHAKLTRKYKQEFERYVQPAA